MEQLRKSVAYLVSYIFKKHCQCDEYITYGTIFENDMFKTLNELDYISKSVKIYDILLTQDGFFPDDILAKKYLNNIMTVSEIINYDIEFNQDDPRTITIKQISYLLVNNSEKFKNNKELTLKISKSIESSCFNTIIKTCKQLEDPMCRHWKSPVFTEFYSNRCGIIYNLLNPESTSCKLYGNSLLQQLINETIDISLMGSMSESELCPQSIQKEKDEIAIRSEQQVTQKESNLFKCPSCNERRVTYREVQLRSIDEAPDYLCVCLICNRKFKGRN